ncbi:hypothetical protein CDD83_7374 [Cordyceps sp. RAO-2017]|nr:hypothetical protein CDD83_7374 [Cordyceps sp. RAO-2017]
MPSAVTASVVLLLLLLGAVRLSRARNRPQAPTLRGRADGLGNPEKPAIEPLDSFDWKSEEPRRFRPFKPVYNISMALQSDAPSDLISIDSSYLNRVNLRRELIRQHGEKVYGYVDGGSVAVQELYAFLMNDYLPTRFPTIFKLSDDGKEVKNEVTGRTSPAISAEDPDAALRTIGETVEEDMFLVHETPNGHASVAFVCCFPAGFDPSAKLGKLLKDIHGPVPSYEKIGPSMERFFSKLQVGKSVKRLNWVVQTHGDLLVFEGLHGAGHGGKTDEGLNIDQTFLRVELQTLTRLPQTRAILFSFKTYLYPINQLKDEGLGPELADAIEGMRAGNAPGMWLYKGGVRWATSVCKYLRA